MLVTTIGGLVHSSNYTGTETDIDTVWGCSRVRFLVSLKVKERDNQVHKSEVEQVIYFSKYNVVLADVNNEF